MRALVDATIELIVDKGTAMSVREISALAGVNHGLVHAYFGGKPGLVQAAFDDIQQRFAAERHVHGFPPPDLAARRDALLAKALARATLEGREGPFSAHRITTGWREAIEATRSDLDDGEIAERVAAASAIGLGYALFADMLSDALDLDSVRRAAVDERSWVGVASYTARTVSLN